MFPEKKKKSERKNPEENESVTKPVCESGYTLGSFVLVLCRQLNKLDAISK